MKKITSRAESVSARAMAQASSAPTHHSHIQWLWYSQSIFLTILKKELHNRSALVQYKLPINVVLTWSGYIHYILTKKNYLWPWLLTWPDSTKSFTNLVFCVISSNDKNHLINPNYFKCIAKFWKTTTLWFFLKPICSVVHTQICPAFYLSFALHSKLKVS